MHHGTAVVLLRSVANFAVLAFNHVIAFDRTHAIYVVFHFRGFTMYRGF